VKQELRELLTVATLGNAYVEGITVKHPNMSKTFYITRVFPGFDAKLETGEVVYFEYCPMRVEYADKVGNLSQEFKVTIQDINKELAPITDQIPLDTSISPTVEVRIFVYRADGSFSDVQDGPYILEAQAIAFEPTGAAFTASPPMTNFTSTGDRFTIKRFPTLMGYTR
jgi:hypothetical protein